MLRLVLQLHGYSSAYVPSDVTSGIPDDKVSSVHDYHDENESGIVHVSPAQYDHKVPGHSSGSHIAEEVRIDQSSGIPAQDFTDVFKSVHSAPHSNSVTNGGFIKLEKLPHDNNGSVEKPGLVYISRSTQSSGHLDAGNESSKSVYSPLNSSSSTFSSNSCYGIMQSSGTQGTNAASACTLKKSSLYLPRKIVVVKSAGSHNGLQSLTSLGSSSGFSSESSGSSGYSSLNSGLTSSGRATHRVRSTDKVKCIFRTVFLLLSLEKNTVNVAVHRPLLE